MDSDRELLVNVRARQMKFVGHIMRIGKIEDLSLTDRIPSVCRPRGSLREGKVYGWYNKNSRKWK